MRSYFQHCSECLYGWNVPVMSGSTGQWWLWIRATLQNAQRKKICSLIRLLRLYTRGFLPCYTVNIKQVSHLSLELALNKLIQFQWSVFPLAIAAECSSGWLLFLALYHVITALLLHLHKRKKRCLYLVFLVLTFPKIWIPMITGDSKLVFWQWCPCLIMLR